MPFIGTRSKRSRPRRGRASSRRSSTPPIHELSIHGLIHGAQGVGRLDGRAIFVPRTVPGDRIKVKLGRDHGSWSEGEMIELLEASPHRRRPPCHIFGRCGGCQWLHVDYDTQLEAKQDAVVQTLRRMADVEAREILPIVKSPRTYHYRHRVRLRCRLLGEGTLATGFMAVRSKRVISHQECWIYVPTIRKALMTAGKRLPSSVRDATFLCHGAHGIDGTALVVETHDAALVPHLARAFSATARIMPLSWRISCDVGDLFERSSTAATISYTVPTQGDERLTLRADAGSFFQANLEGNDELIRTILAWSAPARGDRFLDLYAGVGNITAPLAAAGAEVIAVESDPICVGLAKTNTARWSDQITINQNRVEEEELPAMLLEGDTVVLNPPREGARHAAEAIVAASATPRRILYVSCDPATLARDVKILSQKGYTLNRLCSFDLFPQTYHVESLAELVAPS